MQSQMFSLLRRGLHFNRSKNTKEINLFERGHYCDSASADVVSQSRHQDGSSSTASASSAGSRIVLPSPVLNYFHEPSSSSSASPSTTSTSTASAVKSTAAAKTKNSKPTTKSESSTVIEIVPRFSTEQTNEFRHQKRIFVKGSDIPDPIRSFSDLENIPECRPYLSRNITAAGYRDPTAIQMQAIPILAHGRELLACAPTGTGKTMAFIVPMLMRLGKPNARVDGCRAVVIAPTLELGEQIHREAEKIAKGKPWKIAFLDAKLQKRFTGTMDPQMIAKNNHAFDILITTPLRLVTVIKSGNLDLSHVNMLILDEGDKLFETGFLEQIDSILHACSNPAIIRALFSATLPDGVEKMANTLLRDPIRITIGERNSATSTIEQKLLFVGREEGKLVAIRDILQQGVLPPVLVFVQSIERAKQLFRELLLENFRVDVIHADRTAAQREEVIRKFRLGKTWILITTDVLARGVDFKDVSTVINYDFPQTISQYIHRIGRTGRAGRSGKAITLFTEDDRNLLRSIGNVMKASGCEVPEFVMSMKKAEKSDRRALEFRPPQRDDIAPVGRYDARQKRKHHDIVEASKKRHRSESAQKSAQPSKTETESD